MGPSPERTADAARLLDIVSGSWKTQAVYVAARLGIADRLHDSPRSAAELASEIGAHGPSLERLLRALVAIAIVRPRPDGAFELTPTGSLLREEAPVSLRAWVLHWGGACWPVWGQLLHSVMTGDSARQLNPGTAAFDRLASDSEAARIFHQAMSQLTRLLVGAFVAAVDWTGARKIVDVGGGSGELLVAALGACPGSVGILFDEPHAIELGRRNVRAAGLEHRCEFVAGDFFDRVPEGADTYLLKSVLHDWNDERATAILASCRRALGPAARLLVVERIAPGRFGASPDDQELACMDLHMLVQHGGRERTEAELRELLSDAGLRTAGVKPLRSTLAVIEAVPASANG
ncbi:MAG TPA: methyltransferase [Gemmatimonadota bacterium]|nr:methyltransferase [Gemmatimonadota bacterium]